MALIHAEHDADPAAYATGAKSFDFRTSIYASAPVKRSLTRSHHGKCCFCETPIPIPYGHAHVEHFRPKGGTLQARGEVPILPGYYWLAYDWANLLLSCHFCNSANKGILFPLLDPDRRALNHGMDLADETVLLIKPDECDDIDAHITFHQELPVGLTSAGRLTVEILGLDSIKHAKREELYAVLVERRQLVLDLWNSVDPKARDWARKFRKYFDTAMKPNEPYSRMVEVFVAKNPLPDLDD